jgi:uncharacterized membrane-anchored protein
MLLSWILSGIYDIKSISLDIIVGLIGIGGLVVGFVIYNIYYFVFRTEIYDKNSESFLWLKGIEINKGYPASDVEIRALHVFIGSTITEKNYE